MRADTRGIKAETRGKNRVREKGSKPRTKDQKRLRAFIYSNIYLPSSWFIFLFYSYKIIHILYESMESIENCKMNRALNLPVILTPGVNGCSYFDV